MPAPSVIFEKEAFLLMLSSAIENFRKECSGYIFGSAPTEYLNAYLINMVHPIQLARRRECRIFAADAEGSRRLINLFAARPLLYARQGGFHSHPQQGEWASSVELSEKDIDYMKKNKSSLEVVVSIGRSQDKSLWEVNRYGLITGTLGKYSFVVSAYTLNADGNPKRLRMRARSAVRALNNSQRST
jgi:hypothetical protein